MMLSQQFTRTVLMQLPFLAVYITVLVIAVSRRKHHPSITTLTTVSMATLILASLLSILTGFIPALHWRWAQSAQALGIIYGASSLAIGALAGAAWVFLVAAVFNDRKTPQIPAPPPQE